VNVDRRKFLQLSAAAAAVPVLQACSGSDKSADSNVPQSDFHEDSTAEEVTAGLDLSGKLALVTGCNSGIGFETMRVLALRGAHVIGTGRTLKKAQTACSKVIGLTTPVALELSDFDSIVACADAIRSFDVPLDMLICNAGMRGTELEQVDGIEKHFFVNHLGHFLLVNRLIDRMYYADQGRVVVVGSRQAYLNAPEAGIEFDNISGEADYDSSEAYGHSKLANRLFSLELARLLKGSRITSNCLHPGLIDTNITREMSGPIRGAWSVLTSVKGKTIAQGAATSCYVATSPLLGATSGAYFEDCNAVVVSGDHHLDDAEMASRLWLLSESLVGDYLIRHETPEPQEMESGSPPTEADEQDSLS
jgi:NAD(P)-dependent dehydrogenase (short-subunit alcohol dehydrogenase family)